MTDENNTPYPMQYATLAASVSGLEIWVWVYWVKVWLGLSFNFGAEDVDCQIEMPKPLFSNRAERRWRVHYHRCGCPISDRLHVLYMMLPAGLSENQRLERLSHISKMGRVRIYGMSITSCVRLRRPLLNCYDHGWWRAPLLALSELTCPLRPP